jgi:hypothetical protein
MWNGSQALEYFFSGDDRAKREDHLLKAVHHDLRMGGDICYLIIDISLAKNNMRVAHNAATCAKATIAGTLRCEQHKHAIRIAVSQTWNWRLCGLR